MPKISYRTLRVADLLQRELAMILRRELAMTTFGLITISVVRISPDLRNASIFVTFLNPPKPIPELIKLLNNNYASNFRHQLAGKIQLRVVPDLRFVHDDVLDHGNQLASLIASIPSASEQSDSEQSDTDQK